MCQAIQELIEEGMQQGIQLTKKVFRMNAVGKSYREIAEECKISVTKIREILEDTAI